MNPGKPRILVVDDVLENIQILNEMLKADYEVLMAMNGKAALKVAETDPPPDLILLDVLMPEMDGWAVCRALKESAMARRVPVIFITAMGEVDDETKGFLVGGVDYITKPVSLPILRARVKTHLALQNQNRVLEEKVRERTEELLQTRDVTIFSLSSLAETRDNETGNHIKRTQHYMQLLARHLSKVPEFSKHLNDETVELVYKSAPLHDIGKVGIRDAILLKPGPLTGDEFAIMKTHATIGRDAIMRGMDALYLGKIPSFLDVAMDIAYSHHEKWDGSGYPLGLAGAAIPLSGRLMAICDVYDALISRRVYKPPFSHEKSVEIIQDGCGKHFDPEVTAAFLHLERDFLEIAFHHTALDEEKENLRGAMAEGKEA